MSELQPFRPAKATALKDIKQWHMTTDVAVIGFGGAGKFVDMTANLGGAVVTGKAGELEARDIPFFRKFVGKIHEYEDQSRFYDRLNELKQLADEADSLEQFERSRFVGAYRDKLGLVDHAKEAAKELSDLRKDRKEVEESELSDDRKNEILDQIEAQTNVIIDQFNLDYNSIE